ncbi:MAG: hypothetical protein KAT48_00410 [Bacteroidales bacterium]|nr:hypothetical protein [Bacteroidales bacterium]
MKIKIRYWVFLVVISTILTFSPANASYSMDIVPAVPNNGDTLNVTILDDGNPEPGILVQFALNGGVPVFSITDSQGKAKFKLLNKGNLTIYAATREGVPLTDATLKVFLKGDFSGDDTTDSWDITYLARSISGIPGYDVLSSGDVSGDGMVDAWDCTYLARAIVGVPGYIV